jgi:hypothetical protein
VVNVDAREIQGHVIEAPMLELYRVTGDARTTLTDDTMVRPSPACTNVVTGSNQRVRMDITDLVRDHLREPRERLEFVLGSLTGSRSGLFEVVRGTWGARSVARVTFVTHK